MAGAPATAARRFFASRPVAAQFTSQFGEIVGAAGLRCKPSTLRQMVFPDIHKGRRCDDLDPQPTRGSPYFRDVLILPKLAESLVPTP